MSGFRKCESWREEYSSAVGEPTWPNTDSSEEWYLYIQTDELYVE